MLEYVYFGKPEMGLAFAILDIILALSILNISVFRFFEPTTFKSEASGPSRCGEVSSSLLLGHYILCFVEVSNFDVVWYRHTAMLMSRVADEEWQSIQPPNTISNGVRG